MHMLHAVAPSAALDLKPAMQLVQFPVCKRGANSPRGQYEHDWSSTNAPGGHASVQVEAPNGAYIPAAQSMQDVRFK